MFIRVPQQDPFANSPARLAVLLRSQRGARMIELGDTLVTIIVVIASVLLAWFLFATLYLVLRDDYVVSSVLSERRSAYAYEDRVVDLRQRIDRLTTRQLMSQDSVEVRVASLIARQAELEARHMVVNDLASRAERSNLVTSQHVTAPEPEPGAGFAAPRNLGSARKPMPLPAEPQISSPFAPLSPRASVDGLVGEIERRASVVEREQTQKLQRIGDAAEGEMSRSRHLVAAIGLDPGRFGKNAFVLPALKRPAPLDTLMLRDVGTDNESAIGGPLLPPVPGVAAAERFEQQIQRAEKALEAAKSARGILKSLPVGRPMPDRFEQTSGFGTRVDPFVRSMAMHAGIDFRAPTGTPVKAISAGRIINAGPSGGYGRMIEIDHGFGLTTRYGHLSAIDVSEGDTVEKGEVIGAVGSTGRSTGPHLHYEVRIDDDATDPMRFVRAARVVGM
jgi:murein DD-endopeptidase MepM/ murein hydrolase activator NlpD